jgi:Integrase core domain
MYLMPTDRTSVTNIGDTEPPIEECSWMGAKEVTMEIKYAAMFASVQAGKESVTELCARLVESQPKKRPRSSYRSFEFAAPDDCWQIDAFDYVLAGGEQVVVFEVKDDCSRTQIANLAWTAEDTLGAWECLARDIDEFGKPRLLLSDNSLAFSGKRHNTIVLVEEKPAGVGY